MAGKPVIKVTRFTIEFILNLLAQGTKTAEILDEYVGLTHENFQARPLFAGESLIRTEFMPLELELA